MELRFLNPAVLGTIELEELHQLFGGRMFRSVQSTEVPHLQQPETAGRAVRAAARRASRLKPAGPAGPAFSWNRLQAQLPASFMRLTSTEPTLLAP